MCLFLKNVLILELRAYLYLLSTSFVLVFNKISRKCAHFKVFALCPKKRGRFLVEDQVNVFFSILFIASLPLNRDPKVGRRRL